MTLADRAPTFGRFAVISARATSLRSPQGSCCDLVAYPRRAGPRRAPEGSREV